MIQLGYTDKPGRLQSTGGSSIQGGLVFQLVCRFHRYWAWSSKSTVWPMMESCFQDGARSVCFLLHLQFTYAAAPTSGKH